MRIFNKGPKLRYVPKDANGNMTRFKYAPNSYLTEIIDPRGVRATRTEYDESGRLVRQINPAGDTLKLEHDIANGIETTRDFNDNKVDYTYDEHGNVRQKSVYRKDMPQGPPDVWTYEYDSLDNVRFTHNPDGTLRESRWENGNEVWSKNEKNYITTRTYGPMNQLQNQTDPLLRTTTYHYDPANGNLLSVEGPDHKITNERTYYPNGNVSTEKDGEGNITSYDYNGKGQMTSKTDPLGRVTKYVINDRGKTTAVVNAKGDSTYYFFDANGNQVKTVNALGDSTKTVYNSINKPISKIDARGDTTWMDYDVFGQLWRTRAPDGSFTRKTYDAQGNVDSSFDEVGRVTKFEYDQNNRVVKIILNDGSYTTTEYNEMGRRVASVDARGNRTEYGYDPAGNNTTVTNALAKTTTYVYDPANRRTGMIDALNHGTTYSYDVYDRLTRTMFHDGTYKTTTYDNAGRKTEETDKERKPTAFTYDSCGNIKTVTDAMTHVTRFSYDENNNRTSQTDANTNTTLMAYDKLNRLVLRTYPGGIDHDRFGYDPNGNMVFKVDGEGDSTVFTYDVRNRESLRRFTNSGHTVETRYTEDGKPDTVIDNRGMTTYEYGLCCSQLRRVNNPDGTFIEYDFDDNKNIIGRKTPWGTTRYTFDRLNRMDSVIASDGGVTQYFYNVVGNRDSVHNANSTSTGYSHDALNRLTNVTNYGPGGSVISSYTYTLNDAGIRTAVTEADGSNVAYGYDDCYKLTSETRIGLYPYAISYTYDNVGNRLTKTDSAGITSYTYNTRDQLTNENGPHGGVSYTFDHAGRLTTKTDAIGITSYGWVDDDRMAFAILPTSSVTYTYDAEGARVKTDDGTQAKLYLIDKQFPYGQVIAEYRNDGSLTCGYVYGQERISQNRGGNERFYLSDGQTSIRELTDASGLVSDQYWYTAFGEELVKTGSTGNEFRYVGEQWDPNTHFYYLRSRWMDARVGRFNSSDIYFGDVRKTINLHRYLYAGNSPINKIDPNGEEVTSLPALYGAIDAQIISSSNWSPSYFIFKNGCIGAELIMLKNALSMGIHLIADAYDVIQGNNFDLYRKWYDAKYPGGSKSKEIFTNVKFVWTYMNTWIVKEKLEKITFDCSHKTEVHGDSLGYFINATNTIAPFKPYFSLPAFTLAQSQSSWIVHEFSHFITEDYFYHFEEILERAKVSDERNSLNAATYEFFSIDAHTGGTGD
jgi:RHS repeat-associated protein